MENKKFSAGKKLSVRSSQELRTSNTTNGSQGFNIYITSTILYNE